MRGPRLYTDWRRCSRERRRRLWWIAVAAALAFATILWLGDVGPRGYGDFWP